MKRACALGATFLLFCAAPAAAQVYPGEEVTVNPAALGSGYLLYPGGKYGRHVGHLLQPGERPGAIHLHMPVKHRVARHHTAPPAAVADATTTPDAADAAPPPPTPVAPVRKPKHKPATTRTATATPPPAPTPQPPATQPSAPPPTDMSALPQDSATSLAMPPTGSGLAPLNKPRRVATMPAAIAPTTTPTARMATPRPQRTANTAPPAAQPGLRKQSVIPFAPGASSPAVSDVTAIHTLAATLNASLAGGASRVQLEAYGGPRGDKSPESRRLSIKRALVVRELLIEDGVPSEKIDVRAMAGADDNGPADRVDVFVRA